MDSVPLPCEQLTADEVKAWSAWWTEYRKHAAAIGSGNATVDEAAITAKTAKDAGKTPDEIKAILLKQQVWAN